ncbi:MAG: helix-turn-helix domain-containing protein [Bacteroidales bacterium]|nr:helix-turn-helix domain-containing protein [Bacteroidales bacterium]
MRRTFIILTALLLLAACNRSPRVHQIRNLGDTPYQEDSIRMTYARNPQRALALLDSAILLGNIDPYRALLTRATIYSRSPEESRLKEAQGLCEQLLQHDSVVGVPQRRSAVLDLLVYTSNMQDDNEAYIRWATQKADLCREMGDEVECLRTEAEIGAAMAALGQWEAAHRKLDDAIRQLDVPGSINRMDALSIAAKRKMYVLKQEGRPEESAPVARRVLARLDHYQKHPETYAEDSYRLSWSKRPADRERYLDFTRGQAYANLAVSYAPRRRDSALFYFQKLSQTRYGQSLGAKKMIVPAQMELGMYKEAMATYAQVEKQMGTDTLHSDYALLLRDRALAAKALGRPEEAYNYMQRYAALTKELADKLQASEAHEYAARYHAQEQELAIEKEQSKSRIMGMELGLAVLLLVLAAAVLLMVLHQKRILDRKNRVLAAQIADSLKYKELFQAPGPVAVGSVEQMSDEQLFEQLRLAIKQGRLFLDPAFDRQKLTELFHLSNRQVGAAFSQGSEFSSLSDFIRDCRLEYSCRLLTEHPELSIKEVAVKSGFQYASTYSTDFKNKYTMTPSEYRELQGGE